MRYVNIKSGGMGGDDGGMGLFYVRRG